VNTFSGLVHTINAR